MDYVHTTNEIRGIISNPRTKQLQESEHQGEWSWLWRRALQLELSTSEIINVLKKER